RQFAKSQRAGLRQVIGWVSGFVYVERRARRGVTDGVTVLVITRGEPSKLLGSAARSGVRPYFVHAPVLAIPRFFEGLPRRQVEVFNRGEGAVPEDLSRLGHHSRRSFETTWN